MFQTPGRVPTSGGQPETGSARSAPRSLASLFGWATIRRSSSRVGTCVRAPSRTRRQPGGPQEGSHPHGWGPEGGPPRHRDRSVQPLLISQSLVVGDGGRHLGALITLDPENLGRWAQERGKFVELEALANDPTVAEGEPAPTLKLRRNVVRDTCADPIDEIFSSSTRVPEHAPEVRVRLRRSCGEPQRQTWTLLVRLSGIEPGTSVKRTKSVKSGRSPWFPPNPLHPTAGQDIVPDQRGRPRRPPQARASRPVRRRGRARHRSPQSSQRRRPAVGGSGACQTPMRLPRRTSCTRRSR